MNEREEDNLWDPRDGSFRTRSPLAYTLSVPRVYGCTRQKNKEQDLCQELLL